MRNSWLSSIVAGVGALALVCAGATTSPAAVEAAAAEAAIRSSLALEAKADWVGALRSAREAEQSAPGVYFNVLRVAYLERALEDYTGAARDYGRAAALAPGSIEALLGQQEALTVLGRFPEVEKVSRALLRRDPSNYRGRARLAWCLFNLKRFSDAAKAYAAVLEQYPSDVELSVGLGYSLLNSGKKAEAAASFRRALAMSPDHPRALSGLAGSR